MFYIPLKTTVLFTFGLCCMAFSYANDSDSLKHIRLANAKKTSTTEIVVKEANVLYPLILQGHEDNFTAYVQKFSVTRRAYLLRTYHRSKKFFPKANVILKKYKVPTEFVVLLALESAFNGNAVSSAGAVGYWQIMDDVAKEYGLKIIEAQKKIAVVAKNKKEIETTAKPAPGKKKPTLTDERKNFLKSTHTAARYLRDRMRNLNNDYLLVAASYNCGVGNVWNAMERTGKTAPTFWDIKNYLPLETRAYVMNFIALNVVFKNYENFRSNKLCFKDENAIKPVIKDLGISLFSSTL